MHLNRTLTVPGCVLLCALAVSLSTGCGASLGAGSPATTSARTGVNASAAQSTTAAATSSAAAPERSRARPGLRASITHWHLPAPRYRTDAVARGDQIFVFGGLDPAGVTVNTVEELNLRTGRMSVAGTLALPTHGSAAGLFDGRLLVFGGASTAVHDVVQQFVPPRRTARVIARLPGPRADVTAAVVGHTVVLLGGFDGIGPQRDVWASRDGRHFHVIGALRQAVRYPAVVADGNSVYVFGGLVSGGEYDGQFTNLIQRVRIAPHASVGIAGHLPSPVAHAMGALVGGRILVMGGSTPHGPSNAVLRFDPSHHRVWRATRLPHPLTDAAVAAVGDTAYLLGGISTRPLSGVIAVRLTP